MKKYIPLCMVLFSCAYATVPDTIIKPSEKLRKMKELMPPSLEQVKFVRFELDGHLYLFFRTTSDIPTEFIIHAPSCACGRG